MVLPELEQRNISDRKFFYSILNIRLFKMSNKTNLVPRASGHLCRKEHIY